MTDRNLNKEEDMLDGGRAGSFNRKSNRGRSQWIDFPSPKGRAEMT